MGDSSRGRASPKSPPAAAAATVASDAALRVTLATCALGFPRCGDEVSYQLWRARSGVQRDAWVLALNSVHILLVLGLLVRKAIASGARDAWMVAAMQLAHGVAVQAPPATLAVWQRVRGPTLWRDAAAAAGLWMFALATLAAAVAMHALDIIDGLAGAMQGAVQRPLAFAVTLFLVQPFMTHMGPHYMVAAAGAHVVTTHTLCRLLQQPPPAAVMLAAFCAASVAVAAALDAVARARWARACTGAAACT